MDVVQFLWALRQPLSASARTLTMLRYIATELEELEELPQSNVPLRKSC